MKRAKNKYNNGWTTRPIKMYLHVQLHLKNKLRVPLGLRANFHVPVFSNDNFFLELYVILYYKGEKMKRAVVILNKLYLFDVQTNKCSEEVWQHAFNVFRPVFDSV
jgi:hypothetical protein